MRSVGAALLALALGGDQWHAHAPLPVPRTEVTAAALGQEIAVDGGFLADGGSSRRIDFYAPSSDTWRSGPVAWVEGRSSRRSPSAGIDER